MTDEIRRLIVEFGKARQAYTDTIDGSGLGHPRLGYILLTARARLLGLEEVKPPVPDELEAFYKAHRAALGCHAGDLRAAHDADRELAALGQQLAAADWMKDMAGELRAHADELSTLIGGSPKLAAAIKAIRTTAATLTRKHGEQK